MPDITLSKKPAEIRHQYVGLQPKFNFPRSFLCQKRFPPRPPRSRYMWELHGRWKCIDAIWQARQWIRLLFLCVARSSGGWRHWSMRANERQPLISSIICHSGLTVSGFILHGNFINSVQTFARIRRHGHLASVHNALSQRYLFVSIKVVCRCWWRSHGHWISQANGFSVPAHGAKRACLSPALSNR